MPAHYAHYRFGTQLLPLIPEDVRRCIRRHRALFDVGLHGPDLFFNYSPLHHTPIGDLGHRYHTLTGRTYFTRICRKIHPDEASQAFLWGLLSHYCLDTVCHPFVIRSTDDRTRYHTELEAEFERFLLETDGLPATFDFTAHMHLTPEECAVAAQFYPPATGAQISRALHNMVLFSKLFAAPDGPRRQVTENVLELVSPSIAHIVIPLEPNPNCQTLNGEFLALYEKALSLYPGMLAQLQAHLETGAPLGAEFDLTFDG